MKRSLGLLLLLITPALFGQAFDPTGPQSIGGPGDAISLRAVPIDGSISPADGFSLIFSGSTRKWTPQAGGGGGPVNVQLTNALTHAATTPVNIVVAGDSFTICDQTNCTTGPTVSTNRWAEQLRISLQGTYGNGGTGLVPLMSAFSSPQINSEAWTCTGTFTPNVAFGPTLSGVGSLIQITSGSSCTFHDTRNIPWNSLNIYCAEALSNGAMSVVIDGGSPTTVCAKTASSSGQADLATIATTLSANHTAVFTATAPFSFLYAAQGVNTAGGVSVSNVGVGGAQSSSWSLAGELSFTDLIPGGAQAFIYQIQTNDANAGIATTTFQTNVQATITHELGLTNPPQVILAIPPLDVFSVTHPFAAYTAAQVSLCTSNALQCVNMAANFGPYNASSGLWDLSVSFPGAHPSDLGNSYEFKLVSLATLNRFIDVAQ